MKKTPANTTDKSFSKCHLNTVRYKLRLQLFLPLQIFSELTTSRTPIAAVLHKSVALRFREMGLINIGNK